MEQEKKRLIKFKIPVFGLFCIAILIVLFFSPREAKYKYTYIEDKPWQYSLLTAPFNFYIQKSDEKIKEEKDSIMQLYQPYYMVDAEVSKNNISLFQEGAKAHNMPDKYIKYIAGKLDDIYKAGVISVADYEKIHQQQRKQLLVNDEDNIFKSRHISSFYTARIAYNRLLDEVPSDLQKEVLENLDLNNYIGVNILFDETTSGKVQDELLKQIALYKGEVQQGQKIIDRGELVTVHIKDILDSYNQIIEGEDNSRLKSYLLLFGELILITLLMLVLYYYLRFFRLREYMLTKNILFILCVVIVFPIIVGSMIDHKVTNMVYIIPFAVPTILVRTFIDSRTATVTHIITVLICAMMLPIGITSQFIVIQFLVGYITIFSLRNLSERSQLIYCSLLILAVYFVSYTGCLLATEGDLNLIVANRWIYVYFCINFVLVSFAYLLVYMCERVFGFISEVTMIELSNTNIPLLQKLSERAPGTFQHSTQVSNLVVPAALRIGANPALVRIGAMYHDIGKLTNAAFFTENQSQGMDPHRGLSEKESAKVIIQHVEEGVRIAKKNKLPQQIIDFIETHHGKGMTKYFYNSYVNANPNEEVSMEDFSYPGRNPFSKETALLMMADGVEAASRSLTVYTPETIRALVDKLIDMQMKEGLFQLAPITFKDIDDVKAVFVDKLLTIYHTRISYPELNKKEKEN